jgi:hypothetical protein
MHEKFPGIEENWHAVFMAILDVLAWNSFSEIHAFSSPIKLTTFLYKLS